MSKPLEDYAVIGDGQTMALVARDGAIDWLCLPRFDSDACFAALLGNDSHGSWQIAPETRLCTVTRRYQGDTLILETEFTAPGGRVQVVDFMPIRKGRDPAIVRIVTGLEGRVAMVSRCRCRFDYGTVSPWYQDMQDGIVGKVGPDLIVLRASVPLSREEDVISAHFEVAAGEQASFTLQHNGSIDPMPSAVDTHQLLIGTRDWWIDWMSAYRSHSHWPDFVKRSLIILKALTYFPTGGILAAGTAGLPEKPGGRMNWDYRYCWLRDATFALTAFLNAGFRDEAQAWLHWLLRAIAGNPERIRVAYRVDGGRHLNEWPVSWLPGWQGATPILIGNAAATQRQLDVFGELLACMQLAEEAGLDRNEWETETEINLVDHVERIWREPDQGLWESRGRPRHYVYSKVMAWVAVDRFLKMKAATKLSELRVAQLRDLLTHMHAEICKRGYSDKTETFCSVYGGRQLDGSLLLLPLVGFLPADDPRIARTIKAIEDELMESGLVRRQKPPLFGHEEGTFIPCSCWLANCMILQGRKEEAQALLARVTDIASDLGILTEEYHIRRGRLYGNMPQTLSHLAFINAALNLDNDVVQPGAG